MKRILLFALIGIAILWGVYWFLGTTRQIPLGRFTTDLSERTKDQRHNIELAARVLDGIVIKPNAVFSFNKAVGSCTPEKGYHQAPAIQAGEMRPGWGGGICQLSSTLYNAALLMGAGIEERSPHSTPVRSVPPGRDAMVASGISDLIFRNITGVPITIHINSNRNRLTVEFYGRKQSDLNYNITTHLVSRIPPSTHVIFDPTLPPGSRMVVNSGAEGFAVEVLRLTNRNGHEIRREVLSRDTYKPVERLIKVNNGQAHPVNMNMHLY